MQVRFQTFEQYHGKINVGSTWLRVHGLIKYWREAALYRYGEAPDVMVFQKVYATKDYHFPLKYQGVKILDICDPDWLDTVALRETCDAMSAVVCATEPLAQFVRQITDKPVRVIPDRHDIDLVPRSGKCHAGTGKKLVWFGYRHNAEVLKPFIRAYQNTDYELVVIANEDPVLERAATQRDAWKGRIKWVPFSQKTLYRHLQQADICLLPEGARPVDRFKSNNKTTIAQLAGLPVAKSPEDLDRLADPKVRAKEAREARLKAINEYDVRKSVSEYKMLIDELTKE